MSWINAESLYPSHIFIVWFKTHCDVYKNWVVVPKQAEENAEEDYWAHILYPLVFSHKLLSFDSLMFVLKKKMFVSENISAQKWVFAWQTITCVCKCVYACASVCLCLKSGCLFICIPARIQVVWWQNLVVCRFVDVCTYSIW